MKCNCNEECCTRGIGYWKNQQQQLQQQVWKYFFIKTKIGFTLFLR